MDPTINAATGEAIVGRSPRFSMWVALTVFSVISMGSSIEVKHDNTISNSNAQWAVACSVLSVLICSVLTITHLNPLIATIFVGTYIEGIASFVLTVFWGATVAIVSEVSRGGDEDQLLALLGANTGVTNANLYYFSWASFVTSIILLVNYARHAFGLDLVDEVRNRGARLSLWAALIAACLVVAGASSRTFTDLCRIAENLSPALNDEILATAQCKRTKLGVAVGTIGVFFACLVVGMKLLQSSVSYVMEFGIATMLAILNGFGVAYITSNKGPGAQIGNLYYFSWISFLLSCFLAVECFGQMNSAGTPTTDTTNNNNNNDNNNNTNSHDPYKNEMHNVEVPVESLDDV